MIHYEKEIINYLGLPSIPKREHDGKTPFDKGVAVVELYGGAQAYAACTFNPDKGDTEPTITRVFGLEPFHDIVKVYIVPEYMTNVEEIGNMDLDAKSKKKAKILLDEAADVENGGVKQDDMDNIDKLSEWVFPEIGSKEQAVAWIKRYNSVNHIKGRIPTTEENIKLRLYAIYSEIGKKQK